jgi:small subunit ribosomal protein S1
VGGRFKGQVTEIQEYGAFVELDPGVEGLLHVSDMSWRRFSLLRDEITGNVVHPTDIISTSQDVDVQILAVDAVKRRILVGIKQLLQDPWQGIEAKFPVGGRFKGQVTEIQEYGAFVELEPGVEGLLHVSNMSRTGNVVHPTDIISTSQDVDVEILEVDAVKRRISLRRLDADLSA